MFTSGSIYDWFGKSGVVLLILLYSIVVVVVVFFPSVGVIKDTDNYSLRDAFKKK